MTIREYQVLVHNALTTDDNRIADALSAAALKASALRVETKVLGPVTALPEPKQSDVFSRQVLELARTLIAAHSEADSMDFSDDYLNALTEIVLAAHGLDFLEDEAPASRILARRTITAGMFS